MHLKCEICNGTGRIPNPDFEMCKDRNSREVMCQIEREGDCAHCEIRDRCSKGEWVECYNCGGQGVVVLMNHELVIDDCEVLKNAMRVLRSVKNGNDTERLAWIAYYAIGMVVERLERNLEVEGGRSNV